MNRKDWSDTKAGELTHFDETGASRMVNVSSKPVTVRTARAEGQVRMHTVTLERILRRDLEKGDVLEVARLAGIMAAKRTWELVPLCHQLPLDAVSITFEPLLPDAVRIESFVSVTARTGAEMEALTAVSVAALTIYDMCKSVDRSMVIEAVRLVEKTGGQSGTFRRDGDPIGGAG